jgi:hypothetical protein
VIHEVTLQSYFNPTTFNARQQKPNVRKTLDTTDYQNKAQNHYLFVEPESGGSYADHHGG